jgi:phosphate uptake regulator
MATIETKRKLVQHGDSTLTISLPKKWASVNNLKKGDFIGLKYSQNNLVISPEKETYAKVEIQFNDENEWYVKKILNQLYIQGIDEIKINISNKEQIKLIREGLLSLTGYEIVENKQKCITIKSLTSIDDTRFDDTVRKTLGLILLLLDDYIEDCSTEGIISNQECLETARVISKTLNLSKRLVNKKILYGPVQSKYIFNFLSGLHNISKNIIYSYDLAVTNKKFKLTESELELIKEIREMFLSLSRAYEKLDLEVVKDFLEKRQIMGSEMRELIVTENALVVHFFLDMLKEFSSITNLIVSLDIMNKRD